MELASKYNPADVEGKWYQYWLDNKLFSSKPARMMGKNACWVPGTDHASIATEAKVVNKLAQQGIKKTDLTREEFLKHAWAWTEEHGGWVLPVIGIVRRLPWMRNEARASSKSLLIYITRV